ncbi:MAG: iron chelate uptake ABC transporter family permease subunit [Halobacteriovoraceae bacterium]|nr:iron chelate uptake ABC transporter family permease subunit [Halobacteriovoraceae bacterium]MCB9095690.1 iron chelate uptake ABC transporter family permease subunit [Halobacteriovoraceae bacterium]
MEIFDWYQFSRALVAFVGGFVLSSNGSLVQLITQNPLAAPSTLGIQALAIFILLIGHFAAKMWSLDGTLCSLLLFNLLFFILIFTFLRKKIRVKTFEVKNIILIGLSVNLVVASFYSLIQFVLLNLGISFPTELWFGNFRYVTNFNFFYLSLVFMLQLALAWGISKKLRLQVIGREYARGLGIEVEKLELQSFLLAMYTSAIVTLFFGVFSFAGLIFPHFLRSFAFFRADIHREVLGGGLLSGLVFCLFDQACYLIPVQGAELPLGMLTSILGPLLFIGILLSRSESIKRLY